MRESRMSGLMSGVGKRGVASASVLAPNLDSTTPSNRSQGEDEAIKAPRACANLGLAYSMTFVIPCLVPSARFLFVNAFSC